jgi:spore coat polysaccharide biosynthesis protein SpsF
MNKDLCIVLTARMGSTRLPGKAMADVNGRPLLYWILRRLSAIGNVVLGVTHERDDDALVGLADAMNVPVIRHPKDDVVGTVEAGYQKWFPHSTMILRGLGDCPFMNSVTITRAMQVMRKSKADSFAFALAPGVNPVYGSRETPYSIAGWQLINQKSTIREHVDYYFHEHRNEFNTIYHVAPPVSSRLFRPYRLEVDYPEDLELIRAIAKDVSMLAPVEKIIDYLDHNSKVAMLNHACTEVTGPSCYDYATQRSWMKQMAGKDIVDWDDTVWTSPSKDSQPVFCKSGQCLMGLGDHGILHAKAGRIRGNAFLNCNCGSGLIWQ